MFTSTRAEANNHISAGVFTWKSTEHVHSVSVDKCYTRSTGRRVCDNRPVEFVHGSHGQVHQAWARSRGARFPALSRRAWQAHLRERVEGSVEAVARAPEDAGEREPAQPRRQEGGLLPRTAVGEIFLRRRRRCCRRLCPAVTEVGPWHRANTHRMSPWTPIRHTPPESRCARSRG